MCHAPIVVPQVGGARGSDCADTTRAMRRVAAVLLEHDPDALAVISPHVARGDEAWSLLSGERLAGDFGDFGAPGVGLELPGASGAAEAILRAAADRDHPIRAVPSRHLDHGALVPLHFLVGAGWRGPTVVVGLPWDASATAEAMGEVIGAAARESGQRWALVASGDMSHRLRPGAPAGHHPRAREFDATFVERLDRGDLEGAAAIDPELRDLAAEDVVDPVTVAAAAVGWDASGHRKLCYEGPFGVGYCEAVLHEEPPRKLVDIARGSLAAAVHDEEYEPPDLAAPWDLPRGVFVTLWNRRRRLRGCIGHLDPVTSSLSREVAECSVAAGTRDRRFTPVTPGELAELSCEVSILHPAVPARPEDLDPRRYGIIVSDDRRVGVLLPAIEGVDDAAEQLRVALAKAGIGSGTPFGLQRFAVSKVVEDRTPGA